MLRRLLPCLLSALALSGCATPERAAVPGTAAPAPYGEDRVPVHPAFAAHFTDPAYLDEADETAPFGNDEGFDVLHTAADDGADGVGDATTVAALLEDQGFDWAVDELAEEPTWTGDPDLGIPAPGGSVDAAALVVGAGFTLLRLTGHIDERGRRQTLAALSLLESVTGDGAYAAQAADLAGWRNPA